MEPVEPVEILAEPGSTHEGTWLFMTDLIQIAKSAGCQAVKWQFVSSAGRLCERRNAMEYLDSYRLIQGSLESLDDMIDQTHKAGLQAVVTAYLPEDVVPIAQRADAIKIASFEAHDPMMLRLAQATGRRVIVSTGMMTADDAYRLITGWGPHFLPPLSILHCVSSYPAAPDDLNLSVITRWRWERYRGYRFGFSDHSADVRTGLAATMAGAQTIEVHYRHPETPPTNRDYDTALSPDQLHAYVAGVRWAERARGHDEKAVQPSEAPMLAYRAKHGAGGGGFIGPARRSDA